MFVLIATLISTAILGLMYHISKEREQSYQKRHQQIAGLRQLVHYCRRHRAESHNILVYGSTRSNRLQKIEDAMTSLSCELVANASHDNKPVYRILEKRILKLLDGWSCKNVNQNQMQHGRTIRHCLFLIDELVLTWLAERPNESASQTYNRSWQRIIDSMESLTQFRIAIVDMASDSGYQRLKSQAGILHRRMNQLSSFTPLAASSPATASVLEQLRRLAEGEQETPSALQLYHLSSAVSLLIFNSYDSILEQVAENFYQPLPKLQLVI
jgi:hypothetical protein